MPFSRAVAYAAFIALKWLSVVSCVLFAALALRFAHDGVPGNSIGGALAAAIGTAIAAYVLHRLAAAIQT